MSVSGSTSSKKVASIDIGTNTILLLVGELSGDRVVPLYEQETVVRLGKDLQKTNIISEDAMKRGLRTLSEYLEISRTMGAEDFVAIGTHVLREAQNAQDFLDLVWRSLSLRIEVISPEMEALYSYMSVARDVCTEEDKPLLVVDVGGGSTEFVSGRGCNVERWASLPIGSVHLTESFLLSDPVCEEEWRGLLEAVRASILEASYVSLPECGLIEMVAVGGTATTLASVELGSADFRYEKVHGFLLERHALEKQIRLYRSVTKDQRKRIRGLHPSRADVILAGATILYVAMERFSCSSLRVSCHGVRYGVIYERYLRGKRS